MASKHEMSTKAINAVGFTKNEGSGKKFSALLPGLYENANCNTATAFLKNALDFFDRLFQIDTLT
jgi:hypothetical protein